MVLSKMNPSSIARNMLEERMTLRMLSNVSDPVLIGSSCSSILFKMTVLLSCINVIILKTILEEPERRIRKIPKRIDFLGS